MPGEVVATKTSLVGAISTNSGSANFTAVNGSGVVGTLSIEEMNSQAKAALAKAKKTFGEQVAAANKAALATAHAAGVKKLTAAGLSAAAASALMNLIQGK